MEISVYNQEGVIVGKENLPEEIFGLPINMGLLYQVFHSLESSKRHPYAHTKTRGEVRGGGKKPWRQKGTGRARHGSIRSPLWVGGGVTFGPRNERNFTKKVNHKMKRRAFYMALSSKVRDQKLLVMDSFHILPPKTKLFSEVLSKLPLTPTKTLLVVGEKKSSLIRAGRNIPRVQIVHYESLGLGDVIRTDNLIFLEDALRGLIGFGQTS